MKQKQEKTLNTVGEIANQDYHGGRQCGAVLENHKQNQVSEAAILVLDRDPRLLECIKQMSARSGLLQHNSRQSGVGSNLRVHLLIDG